MFRWARAKVVEGKESAVFLRVDLERPAPAGMRNTAMEKLIDRAALRKTLMAKGEALVDRVVSLLCDGEGRRRADRVVREAVLELGADVLSEGLRQLGHGLRHREEPPDCEQCGGPTRFKQMRQLQVRTVLDGKPRAVASPYLKCTECGAGTLWIRRELGLDRDGFMPALREMAVTAGAIEPFESAAERLLRDVGGVDVSSTKTHELCIEAGEVARTLMADGALGKPRQLRPGEKLYVQIDGGMFFIDREWREVKLAVLFAGYDHVEVSKDRGQVTQRQVLATLGDRHELGRLIYGAVSGYLPTGPSGAPKIKDRVVVLADGAVWIRNLVDEVLPGAEQRLDWYHAVEHIAEAARALTCSDMQRRKWAKRHENLLWEGRIGELLRSIRRKSAKATTASERDALNSLHNYFNERRTMLRYAQARSTDGLIGSGIIESAVNHVLQQRMKRAGMRWNTPGATTMVSLRCAYRTNGGMNDLFRRWNQPAAA